MAGIPSGYEVGPSGTLICDECGALVALLSGGKVQAWERHDAWHAAARES